MSDIILKYQNISILSIAILSSFACIYYNFVTDQTNFKFLQAIICIFSIVDLYYNKSRDIKLHHLFSLGLFYYSFVFNVPCSDINILTYSFIKTEISSIFMVLKFYINKKSNLYHVNNIIFYILFFKLRVYEIYYDVINYDSQLYIIINKYSNFVGSFCFVLSCYGLFILNLYWFFLINKIMYKKLTLYR